MVTLSASEKKFCAQVDKEQGLPKGTAEKRMKKAKQELANDAERIFNARQSRRKEDKSERQLKEEKKRAKEIKKSQKKIGSYKSSSQKWR